MVQYRGSIGVQEYRIIAWVEYSVYTGLYLGTGGYYSVKEYTLVTIHFRVLYLRELQDYMMEVQCKVRKGVDTCTQSKEHFVLFIVHSHLPNNVILK